MTGGKRRALITGGSRGIGAAVCRSLARDGLDIVINYEKNDGAAKAVAAETGGFAARFDVADAAAVDAAFNVFGDVDIVVANAGIALQKLFQDTSPEEWRRVFAVNVDGVYNVCRRAVPHMIREKWGRIVIISSMWGISGASCEAAYSASKAALIGLAKALAKELGPSGVTVNCVCPGVISTDMNGSHPPETLKALREETPLMRLGEPEDVAELVSFLASDRASFITGQIISADGGFGV